MSARSDPQGYYRVLGVPHTATADEIRLAFRARAKESHPDQAGGGNGETFRLIREAYEVLRDPRRRMAYDASGLAAWDRAPAPAWAGGFDERRRPAGGSAGRATGPVFEEPRDPGFEPEQRPRSDGAAGPGAARGPEPGPAAGSDPGFGPTARPGRRQRRQRVAGIGSSRLWPLAAIGLALLLLVALGSLWSANRQLDDRQAVVADLYDRLSRLGEEQAELRSRYRSIAFLDLERALRRGSAVAGNPVTADTTRAAYRVDIPFAADRFDLGQGEEQGLARALVEIAGAIDRLPPDGEWLIVLEAQAARATFAGQIAVESWEAALLRLATVLDVLLAQDLPGERIAVRFNAGFAASEAIGDPTATGEPRPTGAYDRVSVQLLCCID